MQQAVIFTLLPQDRDAASGDWHAFVFVSPHLTPDADGDPAATFPAFRDWPAVVAGGHLIIERRGGPTVEVRPDPSLLDGNLWRTYLAPIPVRGFAFKDHAATEIRSFSAQAVLALAEGLYAAVAAAGGGDHPDPLSGGLRSLGAAMAHLGHGHECEMVVDDLLRRRDGDRRRSELVGDPRERGTLGPARVTRVVPAAALADPGAAALNLAEARRFYDRPEGRDSDAPAYPTPDPAYVPPAVIPPDPDFHEILTALGDHPELMVALGLVIPVVLPHAMVASGGDFRAVLRHDLLQSNAIANQPWTRAVTDGPRFSAVSETGDLAGGVLPLDDTDRYDAAQVDVDSTSLLLEQRVANVYPIADAAGQGQPVTGDLPALRSTGFTVSRLRRSLMLEQRLDRAALNAADITAGQDVVLFAEDLVRGLRVDVHDGVRWRSLMHRGVEYLDRGTGDRVFAVADQEAYLKASSMTSQPGAPVDRAYFHEALFGWDGWSLVVSRPGRHLPRQSGGDGPLADDGEPFPGPLALTVRSSLPAGTLPRLRYGGRYRFRVRTVDLAGGSTGHVGDDPATAPLSFRRFQPVSNPVVVPRRAYTEGESANRLVIRSGVDCGTDPSNPSVPLQVIDPAAYATRLGTIAPRVYARFHPDSQRHLAPPKTSQHEAELLGRFDGVMGLPSGAAGAPAAYREAYARARREQGTLADTTVFDAGDPDAPPVPAAGIHLVPPLARDGDTFTPPLDDRLAALARGVAPDAGFVIVHDTDTLAVPYLPDFLASGMALRFEGAGTASGWTHTEVLPSTGKWPDVSTFRLVLTGGASPAVATVGGVINVVLPPGATAAVRLSSTIEAGSLDLLGVWQWIQSTVPASRRAEVLAGAHQMLTPSDVVTLVHATQRPLRRPAFDPDFGPVRELGQTHTGFGGLLLDQSATTGRLDVNGTWSEWWDEPASGRPPALLPGRVGHAFDLTVADGEDAVALEAGQGRDLRHEFGDTKHRLVDYAVTATSRFREYLPPSIAGDVDQLRVGGPGSPIHVPNVARPHVPVVHSVIPTFRWDDGGHDPLDPRARARTRHGGLRVWLHRPWYVSGEGEMLGVLLSGADALFAAGDARRQYVSLWGKDPIRTSGGLTAAVPRPRDFGGVGLLQMDRLTLGELGDAHPGVTVVGHPVTYSPSRDLWYADLDVDPGEAYWPFLRLSLARLQPWSVAGAHLSHAVVVDFVQLTNDRTASVTRPAPDVVRVTLTGIEERRHAPFAPGPAASQQHGRPIPIDVAVLVEPNRGVRAWVERRGPLRSDLDWAPVGEVVDLVRIDEDELMRVWSGDVALAVPVPERRPGSDPSGGSARFRLVIAEWESLPADEPFAPSYPVERIVYLDRFPL